MVQKEILEAGLGDVHVAQLDTGSGGQSGDFRNERTAAVGVEIGAVAVRRAHLPDTGQAAETLEQVRRRKAEAEAQQVAAGNGGLQLLGSSQCDDATVVDDRETFTERVGFFHVVRGEENGFAALVVFADDFPQQQTGLWVQAGAWLVSSSEDRPK